MAARSLFLSKTQHFLCDLALLHLYTLMSCKDLCAAWSAALAQVQVAVPCTCHTSPFSVSTGVHSATSSWSPFLTLSSPLCSLPCALHCVACCAPTSLCTTAFPALFHTHCYASVSLAGTPPFLSHLCSPVPSSVNVCWAVELEAHPPDFLGPPLPCPGHKCPTEAGSWAKNRCKGDTSRTVF